MTQVYTHTEFEHYLSILIAGNGILQLLLDIVMEALHIVPTRINHLALTILNAFLAWKTLSAIQKDKFKFLHEDCQVLFLMELFLIAGDVYYVFVDDFSYQFIYARLFFIICSAFNFFAVIYIMHKYSLWSLSYQGDIVESEIVDESTDNTLSIFYRPSMLRKSEAIDMEKDAVELRRKSSGGRSSSTPRSTTTPLHPTMESLDENAEEGVERDSSL